MSFLSDLQTANVVAILPLLVIATPPAAAAHLDLEVALPIGTARERARHPVLEVTAGVEDPSRRQDMPGVTRILHATFDLGLQGAITYPPRHVTRTGPERDLHRLL